MKTVLIADDSNLTLEIVSPIIENSGYRLITVSDGKQAIDACCEQHPDLILMDLHMPNMDGFKATKFLRDKGFTLPIIAFTYSERDDDKLKAKQAGCNEFILKTMEMKEVEQVVDNYLYDVAVAI